MAERDAEAEDDPRRHRGRGHRGRPPPSSESGEKLKAELDDLLDEIDEVLEANAEDFVKSLRAEGRPVASMAMPIFAPGDDPGPSFPDLLRRIGATSHRPLPSAPRTVVAGVPHATTVCRHRGTPTAS